MSLLQKGHTLANGDYVIEELLGQGAMGAVYRAQQKNSGQIVAIKTLLTTDEKDAAVSDVKRRFRDEALAASRVEHPSLVDFIDRGEDDTVGPYIVFEFVQGDNLRKKIKQRQLMNWQEAFEKVAKPILSALGALHRAGIVHRDVKPENIISRPDGTVVLADLGLATFEAREAKTKTGVIVGTPGYVPPERLLNSKERSSPAGDVYAAALVLVEATTGELPFEGKTAAEMIQNQLRRSVKATALVSLGLPSNVAAVLAHALKVRPSERPLDGNEFLSELERALKDGAHHQRLTQPSVPVVSIQKEQRSLLHYLSPLLLLVVIVFIVLMRKPAQPSLRKTNDDGIAAIGEIIEERNADELRELFSSLQSRINKLKSSGVTENTLLSKYLKPVDESPVYYALCGQCALNRSAWQEARDFYKKALLLHRKKLKMSVALTRNSLALDILFLEGYCRALSRSEKELTLSNLPHDKLLTEGVKLSTKAQADFKRPYRILINILRGRVLVESALRLKISGRGGESLFLAAYQDARPALRVMATHPELSPAEIKWAGHTLAWCDEPSYAGGDVDFTVSTIEEYNKQCDDLFERDENRLKKQQGNLTRHNRKVRKKFVLPQSDFSPELMNEILHGFRAYCWLCLAASLSPETDHRDYERIVISSSDVINKSISGGLLEMAITRQGWGPGFSKAEQWQLLMEGMAKLCGQAWQKENVEDYSVEYSLLVTMKELNELFIRSGYIGSNIQRVQKAKEWFEPWCSDKEILSYHLFAAQLEAFEQGNNAELSKLLVTMTRELSNSLSDAERTPFKRRQIYQSLVLVYEQIGRMMAKIKQLKQSNSIFDHLLAHVDALPKNRKKQLPIGRLELIALIYRLDSIHRNRLPEEQALGDKLMKRLSRLENKVRADNGYHRFLYNLELVLKKRPTVSR